MGKRAKKERDRRRLAPAPLAPSPRPPPGTSCVGFANWLGHYGVIVVLFETPSGFAILYYDGVKLLRSNALENIWSQFINKSTVRHVTGLEKFQIFEDKASAINTNGVCPKLAKMIKRSVEPGQKLAVGKQEYKDIIEASLGIHCLFDEAVLELMWGLKNLIKVLVPDEELELTNEDRLQISRGMKLVLDRYGFEVEASLVNSDIIDMASTLYECDLFERERASVLQYGSEQLEKVSGIDSKNWNSLKLATALKFIFYPQDGNVVGDSEEMLSETEAARLAADAQLYKRKLDDWTYMAMYKDIVWVYGLRGRARKLLGSIVKEAKDLKLHQGSIVKEEEQDLNLHTGRYMVKEAKEKVKLHQGCWTLMD